MKTRELTKSELQMLGLDSGTISTQNKPAQSIIKPAVTLRRKVSTNLQPYVGMFIKTKDGHYGMVDDIHGENLGFVWSDKDSWTGELIKVGDVAGKYSATTIDGAKAFRSAQTYFKRESESLRARIAHGYAMDNKQRLDEMLTHCETWLRKLA